MKESNQEKITMGVVIHQPNHWILAIMDFENGIIYVIDPLHDVYNLVPPILTAWYHDAFQERFRIPCTKQWIVKQTGRPTDHINTPRQTDGSSCGIYSSR